MKFYCNSTVFETFELQSKLEKTDTLFWLISYNLSYNPNMAWLDLGPFINRILMAFLVTRQYYHELQCLTFPRDCGKVRKSKLVIEKNKKPSLKIKKFEQISELCDKPIYLPTWSRVYIYKKT